MADSFTSYNVDNDKRFRKAIQELSEEVQDLRIPFGLILKDFYKSEQSIFQLKSEGRYPVFKGKKLKSGKTAYQEYKIKKYGFDYPLLVARGKLAASLLGPNNQGSIADIKPLSLIFGTSIKYGVYHQSDAPRSKIPLRKFLFIGPESGFANDEQKGRLERWIGYMYDYLNIVISKRNK